MNGELGNGELEPRADRESVGQRLRARREAAGLTIATAAAKLHCDQAILTALEADRFEDLGAPVFAQGHLRRYAELVGAPVGELLADWAKRGTPVAAPDLTRVPRAPSRGLDREIWGRRLGGLAGALVIAVAAWWILQGGAVQTPPASASVSASVSAPLPATASVTPASSVTATAPVAAEPAPLMAAAPAAAGPRASALVALSIEARADCWTEVYDADGRKLYFDTLRSGKRANVEGVPPLRVLLGRADRAALSIDGQSVAIPAALIRNTTAYFSVDGMAQLRDVPRPSATP